MANQFEPVTYHSVKEYLTKHGFELLTDKYVNCSTKFKIKCPKGHISQTCWSYIKNNVNICSECANEVKGKSLLKKHDTFIKQVEILGKSEYKVLTQYEHNAKPVQFLHKSCGRTFSKSPNKFLGGQRCTHCARENAGQKLRKAQETFEKQVLEKYGEEFIVVSDYINDRKEVLIKHNKSSCNYIFPVIPGNFIKAVNFSCANCGHRKRNRTTKSLNEEIRTLTNNEYELVSEYVNMSTKVTIKHIECGRTIDIEPTTFIKQGVRCRHCWEEKRLQRINDSRKSSQQFKEEVFSIVGTEYEVLGEYKGARTPILMKHNNCGRKWPVRPTSFLSHSSRCPDCYQSNWKGEKKIKRLLDVMDVKYIRQFYFEDCKNIKTLHFDFAIFNDDGSIAFLCEYDGKQHFEPVTFGEKDPEKAKKTYQRTKERDCAKNEYCKKNNITLLRIPYWNFNEIEITLTKKLRKYGLIY